MTGREQFWRIDGAAEQITDLPIDRHSWREETHTYGQSYRLRVIISRTSDDPSGDQRWPGYKQRSRLLRETYQRHAGQFKVHSPIGGRATYTQFADAPSLLIALKPPARMADDDLIGRGMWALVEELEDRTRLASHAEFWFKFVFMAPLDAYPDTQTALANLESTGV